MYIGSLAVEESDRMQLEENASGPFTSRLNNIHLESRIHLQVHSTSTWKHTVKKGVYRRAGDNGNNQIINTGALSCTLPGSTSQASHSTLEWQLPLAVTWWTVCNIMLYKHSLIIAWTLFELSAHYWLLWVYFSDLMRRSWQSSCRWLILSGRRFQVPPSPSHTRRFIATRKAFI